MPRQNAQPDPEPNLRVPLTTAQRTIAERIEGGVELAHRSLGTEEELRAARDDYRAWDDYNNEWLRRNIGERIARDYSPARMLVAGGGGDLQQEIRWFVEDVSRKIAKLRSIRGRLPLWADEDSETGVPADISADGPVFVVHGSNLTRAEQVARMVERSTSRDAVILHEEASQGRTILEKFEHHAAAASFAIVLLTADDEGRRIGANDELQPRGRQNVVFELGFFFSRLGRSRVVVLVDPNVERPSDIDGLVYVALDDGGTWKQHLARELQTAHILVNVARIP